jgi:hypothetical protein
MSDPTPDLSRIRSEYQPTGLTTAPRDVLKWETWTNEAPNDLTALIQLTYFQALQIRTIKLILIWTMIIVPIAIGAALIILTQTVDKSTPSFQIR